MKKKMNELEDEFFLEDDEFFLFDEIEAYNTCDGASRQKYVVSDCMNVMPVIITLN